MNNLLSPIIVKFDSVVTKVIVQFKKLCVDAFIQYINVFVVIPKTGIKLTCL